MGDTWVELYVTSNPSKSAFDRICDECAREATRGFDWNSNGYYRLFVMMVMMMVNGSSVFRFAFV
jgi:hypothetical protein